MDLMSSPEGDDHSGSAADQDQSENAGPSRNSKQQQQAWRPRSRRGCLCCRVRRIKCDLGRPECARCIKYGAECVYAEKVQLAKQYENKRSKKKRRAPPTEIEVVTTAVQGQIALENGSADVVGMIGAQISIEEFASAIFRSTRMGAFFVDPAPPPSFLKQAFSDNDDLRCMHHCLTYTLSILVVDETSNPWVTHVAPLFLFPSNTMPLGTEALKYGMLYLGATHLSYLQHLHLAPGESSESRDIARRYRESAVKALRRANASDEEKGSDQYLSACSLLMNSDILATNQSWREVLLLAFAGVRHKGGCSGLLFGTKGKEPSFTTRFALQHLAMMAVAGSLTTGQPCVLIDDRSTWLELLILHPMAPPAIEPVEQLSGYHRILFPTVSRVALLVSEAARLSSVVDDPTSASAILLTSNFDQLQTSLGERAIVLLDTLEQQFSALQGLETSPRVRVGSLAIWHASRILIWHQVQRRSRDDIEVQASAGAILDHCLEVGEKIEWMNWPLLVASSVLILHQDREKARQIFKTFSFQCCHEIEVVREIGEETWRRIDMGVDDVTCSWRDILLEIGRPCLLA